MYSNVQAVVYLITGSVLFCKFPDGAALANIRRQISTLSADKNPNNSFIL
jgi:hypothetical protein